MIKLSKERNEDTEILVFDVRPKKVAMERRTQAKVLLGRITPPEEEPGLWRWESSWGFNRGETMLGLDVAQEYIVQCARGMYQ